MADELGAELVRLDVLTPEQAVDLLTARLGRELLQVEWGPARSVAAAVGHLPLALELAAAASGRGAKWGDLRDALEAEVARTGGVGGASQATVGPGPLTGVVQSQPVGARGEDPAGYEAFVWLGVLPEDATACVPMAATLWAVTTAEAGELLELLWSESLLLSASPVQVGGREWPSYRVHDLLHDLAGRLLPAPTEPKVLASSPVWACPSPRLTRHS